MREIPVADVLDANHVLVALIAFKKGDFSVRLPVNQVGLAGEIADALNDIFELSENMAKELARVATAVGKEGRISQRASLSSEFGMWNECAESVMPLEVEGRQLQGEFIRTVRVVNTMVDQLNSFSSEVTRVAREVGTQGKLGGQAEVRGIAGTWKDFTDNINLMAANLTTQVRGIAKVVTTVADGDLKRKLVLETKGEIAELADTILTMDPASCSDSRFQKGREMTKDCKLIFLAEDNLADVQLIEEVLKRQSVEYRLYHYMTAEEAIDAARKAGTDGHPIPDLILLDYNLPRGHGCDILAAASTNPNLKSVPKAIVSSFLRPEEKARAIELGALRFITKPASLKEFLRSIGTNVVELLDLSAAKKASAAEASDS